MSDFQQISFFLIYTELLNRRKVRGIINFAQSSDVVQQQRMEFLLS